MSPLASTESSSVYIQTLESYCKLNYSHSSKISTSNLSQKIREINHKISHSTMF